MREFTENHPYWFFAIVTTAVLLAFAGFIWALSTGVGAYYYEYETIDGEKGKAEYCIQPYRGVPYCEKEDGTMIYGLKSWKKVAKEDL